MDPAHLSSDRAAIVRLSLCGTLVVSSRQGQPAVDRLVALGLAERSRRDVRGVRSTCYWLSEAGWQLARTFVRSDDSH